METYHDDNNSIIIIIITNFANNMTKRGLCDHSLYRQIST